MVAYQLDESFGMLRGHARRGRERPSRHARTSAGRKCILGQRAGPSRETVAEVPLTGLSFPRPFVIQRSSTGTRIRKFRRPSNPPSGLLDPASRCGVESESSVTTMDIRLFDGDDWAECGAGRYKPSDLGTRLSCEARTSHWKARLSPSSVQRSLSTILKNGGRRCWNRDRRASWSPSFS